MSEWVDVLFYSDVGSTASGPEQVVFLMVLALTMGQMIGWTYIYTHRSLSYSQTFSASLVMLPVLVSFLMMLMVGSLTVTFGLLAVFAVVRFRNVLKDTRDTTFVLWSIVQGMAVGTGRPGMALIGLAVIGLVTFYLGVTGFGRVQKYDVILNLLCSPGDETASLIRPVLDRHALRVKLSSRQVSEHDAIDLAYRVLLRDPDRSRELQDELEGTRGVERVSLFVHGDESEV